MAKRYLLNLFKIFVFYLLLFFLCRAVYLLYFAGQIRHMGAGVFLLSFYHAFPLDVSAACYLLVPAMLLLFLSNFFLTKFLMSTLRFYLFATALFCALLSMGEIGVYQEVHTKMYFNMLTHLQHTDELFHSIPFTLMFSLLSLVGLLGYISSKLLEKLLPTDVTTKKPSIQSDILKLSASVLLVVALLLIGCHGSLRKAPICGGDVYFSDDQCVNDATVNPMWNMGHSYIETQRTLRGEAYKLLPDNEANEVVNKIFSVEKDTTIQLFKVARPNVCVLILESWSADLIESLGGYKGLTPNFEKLISNGYLFTHVKPAGHVSDQGVPAVLSAYPALPIGSAINQPKHLVHLANINNQLSANGYYSSFFFGGHLIYGNIKTYIDQNGFNRVIEQQDLPPTVPSGRLGIHDSMMLCIWHDSMNTYKQPFLTGLFTLSTHAPFDAISSPTINWGGCHNEYLSTAVYADRQLGKFFEDIKKEKWYDSTIFIIVADHSHAVPKDYPYESPEFYHIPLLIYGGALKEEFRGAKYDHWVSQTDIAATLLHQLGYSSQPYRWSKNLMNPYSQQFAFYTFDEGFGFVDSSGLVIWNNKFPSENRNTGKTEKDKIALYKKGAAMLQVLIKDFLSK